MFQKLVGNEPVKAYLEKAVAEGLPQTLLFEGMEGVGKALFARELAERVLGRGLENCPDFHWVRPEGKSGVYAIDTVREVIEKDHRRAFEGEKKVFVLEYAERMQAASANALLKTLEEPGEGSVFVLISSAPQEMLPTVLSRCIRIAFGPVGEGEIRGVLEKKGLDGNAAKWAGGSVGRAVELAERKDGLREVVLRMVKSGDVLERLRAIGEVEKKVDEVEDPILASRLVETVLAQVLMWHRDQVLRKVGGREELAFFTERGEGKALEEMERRVAEARGALQRNMRLGVCLERLLA